MPAFVSPLDNPGAWTYSIVELTLPAGLRYAAYTVRALRAQHATGDNLVMPTLGVIGRATATDGRELLEIQTVPFPLPIRGVVNGLTGGLPTFYFALPDATSITVLSNQMAAASEILAAAASDVTIAVVFQDRITRDPSRWASEILAAMEGTPENNATLWEPFAAAIDAQTNSGPRAPVLLLDHAGQPVKAREFRLITDSAERRIAMDATDLGDAQRAIARLDPDDPGLWSGANTALVVPEPSSSDETQFQLTLLEDPAGAVDQIAITPARRHVLLTDVHEWFAPQFAIPAGASASPLARISRGNHVTPQVNGPEFFNDFFVELAKAATTDGRLDLAGFAVHPTYPFVNPDRDEDPATLEEMVRLIVDRQGFCRILPAQFLQLNLDGQNVGTAEVLAFHLIVVGILILNAVGFDFARTDAAGIVILVGLLFTNAVLVSLLFETGGTFLEPNKSAVDLLNPIDGVDCVLAAYPATVADNTANTAGPDDFPFDTLFTVIRHFGIYHQKFAVVRTADRLLGYCGGIDLNPDRLDDESHLHRSPYHDLHAKVEGPAVADLAISFNERWARDGTGETPPVGAPDPDELGRPGTDIVQVARTYFAAADSSRALEFAPQGDRTIANTMIAAIGQAQEFIYIEDQYLTPPDDYRAALVAKVESGLRKLIIVIPSIADQPFGEIARTDFIAELQAADAGRHIVHVGYPRRRYTVPGNDLRSSSGKLFIAEYTPAASGADEPTVLLAPPARVPLPPFWLVVDGELMWVYDEASDARGRETPPQTKRMRVVRGAETRLVKGGANSSGATPREHFFGTPATVVDLSAIYVHAKMMIVDDAFLCIGSANLNRRGLFYDGELNIFTMPERLSATRANPVAALRRKLWAEMLDLPTAMDGLLTDPVAAATLFERSWLFGNRFVDFDAAPSRLLRGATTGDSLVTTLLSGFVFGTIAIDHVKLFDAVVDPSSSLEDV